MQNKEEEILEKLHLFEVRMTRMLHKLDERISAIETNFGQAAQLANGLMEGNSFFNRSDLESFKDTLLNSNNSVMPNNIDSLSDMMESLKGFKDKLSGIQNVLRTQVLPADPK